MSDEWLLAAGICAVPFLVFGAIELAMRLRRRRLDAIARRPKAIARDRAAGNFGRAD